MRHPTFFAHARPRFDHQVYCLGRGSTRRNTSTQPTLSKVSVSQARSSGRNPEFLRFPRQFSRSISLCAMFQSPQRTNSRPLALSFFSTGVNSSRKRNFACCRSSELDPEGMYTDTTESAPKSARRNLPSGSNSRLPKPRDTLSGSALEYSATPLPPFFVEQQSK